MMIKAMDFKRDKISRNISNDLKRAVISVKQNMNMTS
jgi:hypothetical protein